MAIGWLLCLGIAVTLIYAIGFWPGSVPQLHRMDNVHFLDRIKVCD